MHRWARHPRTLAGALNTLSHRAGSTQTVEHTSTSAPAGAGRKLLALVINDGDSLAEPAPDRLHFDAQHELVRL